MAGPLRGLKILDVTRGTAGAVAAMLLADYGAEVLRIEPPGGDPLWDDLPGYPIWHRGKQIIELDLHDERAKQAFRARFGVADALLESFAPGTMARLGLDFAAVHALAPALVYVSISAYGQIGPDRDRPGYDALVQARSGVCHFQGSHRGRPAFCALPWPSFGAGLLATIGLLAALEERRRTGVGQQVDTSLLDGVLAQSTMFVLAAERGDESLAGPARLSGRAPTMAVYRCGDGRFLQLHAGQRGALERLLAVVGLAVDDFVAPSSGRHFRNDPEGAERLRRALEASFASRPCDVWVELLGRADVAAAPCLEPGAALEHAQTRAIGMAAEMNDPLLGPITSAGLAIRFERSPGELRGPAIRRGQTPNPEAALRHAGWPRLDELQAGSDSGSARSTTDAEPRRGDEGGLHAERGATERSPLEGITVLDFGMFAAGPYAATLLADLGARVVKIEPLQGDTMRPAMRNFAGLHRGKRGLAIDLKAPGASTVVERLVRAADVLVHNFRPGVAERLGIAWERCAALHPRLVYCHSSAYGSVGPFAGRPGFDQIYQAFCGLEVLQAGSGQPPEQVAGAPLDYANALLAAAAILMALRWREESGMGQAIECPQLAAGLLATADVYRTSDGDSRRSRMNAEQTGYSSSYRLHRAGDGWLFVCCPDDDARQRFAEIAGDDPEGFFAGLPADEAIARLARAGIPGEIARDVLNESTLDDPDIRSTGRLVATTHPELGRVRQAGGFIRFSSAVTGNVRPVPRLGEHTREILGELGFSANEVEQLHRDGVVVSAEDRRG